MHRLFSARMVGWLYVSLALAVLIGALAPYQLPVSAYKLSLITAAAWVGYWIDRALFPYARPHLFTARPYSVGGPMPPDAMVERGREVAFAAAMLRRALIIAAAMIGVALGA